MRYFEVKKPRIEIIPMIDIMLFLLVFFAMMTLKMIPTSGQLSKLPTSTTASVIPPPKLLIEIGLDAEARHLRHISGRGPEPCPVENPHHRIGVPRQRVVVG